MLIKTAESTIAMDLVSLEVATREIVGVYIKNRDWQGRRMWQCSASFLQQRAVFYTANF